MPFSKNKDSGSNLFNIDLLPYSANYLVRNKLC